MSSWKQKYYCSDCRRKGMCSHGKRKYNCKDCGGSQVKTCDHGKIKYNCNHCRVNQDCEHGKQKYYCNDCGGKGMCIHGKRKYNCKDCSLENRVSSADHNLLRNSDLLEDKVINYEYPVPLTPFEFL